MRGSDSRTKPPADFSYDYPARPGVEGGEIHATPPCAPPKATGDGLGHGDLPTTEGLDSLVGIT
jgi:hypothetical protein